MAYVGEDLVRQSVFTPNDYYYAGQQSDDFGLINCPSAWDVSKGDGIRVAVLDTGCQASHPDLSGKVKAVRNFTASGKVTDVKDADGHGTHTAGTVGAGTNNKANRFNGGVASAGFNCELAIGKVLGPQGGYDSWVAAGIDGSRTVGAKVVNLSLGGEGASTTLENAIDAAWSAGLVRVAAAGNSGTDASNFYPAASLDCISVAATDNQGALASFSNWGPFVDLDAPGVSICSTYKNSGYAPMSGTSMAAPHVSGVAALVWAVSPSQTNAQVRSKLEGGATRPVTGPNAGDLKVLDAAASGMAP